MLHNTMFLAVDDLTIGEHQRLRGDLFFLINEIQVSVIGEAYNSPKCCFCKRVAINGEEYSHFYLLKAEKRQEKPTKRLPLATLSNEQLRETKSKIDELMKKYLSDRKYKVGVLEEITG